MKRVFISHPYQSDPWNNQHEIYKIGKRLAALNIAYFSPIMNYAVHGHEESEEREFGLRCCDEWISQCDELWLFGKWEISEGCQREVARAIIESITIRIISTWENELPVFDGPVPDWLKFPEAHSQDPVWQRNGNSTYWRWLAGLAPQNGG